MLELRMVSEAAGASELRARVGMPPRLGVGAAASAPPRKHAQRCYLSSHTPVRSL